MGTLSGSCDQIGLRARNITKRNCHLLQAGEGLDGFGGELDIDVPVGRPVGLVKLCPVRHGVEERPECGIAAPVVELLELLEWNTASQGRAPDWFRLVQIGSDWFRLVQTGPDWSGLVQTGSDWFRLVQTGSDWSRMVQTGPVQVRGQVGGRY